MLSECGASRNVIVVQLMVPVEACENIGIDNVATLHLGTRRAMDHAYFTEPQASKTLLRGPKKRAFGSSLLDIGY